MDSDLNQHDASEKKTASALEKLRYEISLIRDRLHGFCEQAGTTDDELRSFVPVLQIEECVDDLTALLPKENT
jgi:hypothetical protein